MPLITAEAPVNRSISPLRYLDVAVVLVAAAPALLLGVPALGYVIGAAGWIVQRIAQAADRNLITGRVHDPVRRALTILGESFGRIWLLAGAIVIAAVAGSKQDGLTAAVVILVAYSVAFAIRLITGAAQAAAAQETHS
ncbi:MAG: hypothetical protein J2O48_12275 [Solirubrobacterales bacterium]|nr:hypothetical protein [Solirubrobacterales bacterium]